MGKRRWAIYIAAGIAFGVLDWHYLELLARFPWGRLGESILVVPVIILLNCGIWLVAVIPCAFLEIRHSRRIRLSALAGSAVWCGATLGYYAYYTALLAFAGLPHLDHLLLRSRNALDFSAEWAAAFDRMILSQLVEWIPIALAGGAIAGSVVGYLYLASRRPAGREPDGADRQPASERQQRVPVDPVQVFGFQCAAEKQQQRTDQCHNSRRNAVPAFGKPQRNGQYKGNQNDPLLGLDTAISENSFL